MSVQDFYNEALAMVSGKQTPSITILNTYWNGDINVVETDRGFIYVKYDEKRPYVHGVMTYLGETM